MLNTLTDGLMRWLIILAFIMSSLAVVAFLFLAWLIHHDEKEVLKTIREAYQEGRQAQAKSMATPGGNLK